MDYQRFLQGKCPEPLPAGFEPLAWRTNLKDFQSAMVKWACRTGRAAIFAECGLGKTLMQLEWGHEVVAHTRQPVLILAPLAVSVQTIAEGERFGLPVHDYRSVSDPDPAALRTGLYIINYEQLENVQNLEQFAGVVLDESSILKAFMGKTKRRLVEAFAGTPYKLCCTATPSPNDHMEILNHAEFLGVMEPAKALAIWFINDTMNMGKYRLKGHGVSDFWRWVGSWAISLRKPSDLGFSDEGYDLPPLREMTEIVDVPLKSGDGQLFRTAELSATNYNQEKRNSLTARVARTVELVLSPFMGVGSEGVGALRLKRRFVGFELKEAYHRQALRYLSEASETSGQTSLFEGLEALA